ncbi:MAG TPA: LysM domain-containing protein [Candidatus Limnocylindrales bacterium]|nr:LysM domain-containing protein [Candidatus Limnocylindrales bacterium]
MTRSPRFRVLPLGFRFAAPLAAVLAVAGCLPESIGPSRSPGPSSAIATTASPSPSGPTPLPSFVRPTATPMPTFLIYTVVAGDNLTTIAHRFATTGRSIAFWNRASYPSLDPESAGYAPNRLKVGWKLNLIPGVVFDEESLP